MLCEFRPEFHTPTAVRDIVEMAPQIPLVLGLCVGRRLFLAHTRSNAWMAKTGRITSLAAGFAVLWRSHNSPARTGPRLRDRLEIDVAAWHGDTIHGVRFEEDRTVEIGVIQ